jgi:hemerythrin
MTGKRINWEPGYELGIEDIDFQHHFFLNLINRLADELRMTTSQNRRSALIAELNAYARFHFISEENMMARAGYPDLEAHRKHHLDLISQLNSREALLQLEQSEQSAEQVIDFLVSWFVNHTTGEDRLFADFYHRQQNR